MPKEASENAIEKNFSKLLPGSKIYTNNFYLPLGKKKGEEAENDIIIIYDSILIIIEIKASMFIQDAPILAYKQYNSSYKKLVEQAASQCTRINQYLESSANSVAKLYNSKNKLKASIAMRNIQEKYLITVSIDNINTFSNQIMRLDFLKLQKGIICLTIDELLVYRDYFENPLYFLHFLKHRKEAGKIMELASDDELNHLGAYIFDNNYEHIAKEEPNATSIFFDGMRDEIDKYFYSKSSKEKKEKPSQPIPKLMKEIISYMQRNEINNRVIATNYLLDLSFKERDELCKKIEETFALQKKDKKQYPIILNDLQPVLTDYNNSSDNFTIVVILGYEDLKK